MDFEFVYGEIKPSAISCLAFKWQEPQALDCGDAASSLRAWRGACARGVPARTTVVLPLATPQGPMSQAGHCFLLVLSQLSPPFTGGETEARGDLAHASPAVGGEEICVGRKQGKWAGLWAPAKGHLGFNFLVLGIKGWAV